MILAMDWRITGTEQTGAENRPRRDGTLSWEDGTGLSGTDWALERLRALDGNSMHLGPAGTPYVDVDLSDPASAFWAATTLFWRFEADGDVVPRTWTDNTPSGAVN